ncbi:hypothetical protein PAZ_c24460 [Cutibacterium acnes 266]|nr:hypothetical protein PAZ_c24460 [Cutibacterium acnes 266]
MDDRPRVGECGVSRETAWYVSPVQHCGIRVLRCPRTARDDRQQTRHQWKPERKNSETSVPSVGRHTAVCTFEQTYGVIWPLHPGEGVLIGCRLRI